MPILPPSSLNKKCPDVTGRYVATYWYRSHSTFPYHADPDVMQSYASKYGLDIWYGLVWFGMVMGKYVATYWYRSHSTFPYHADPDVMQSYASKYGLDIWYG